MKAPEMRTAFGIVRRVSTISSPIVDGASTPAYANAIVEKKIRSLRSVPGMNERGVIGVADPYFDPEYRPNRMRNATGIHPAIAPTLLSHLPMLRPMTLSQTDTSSPTTETVMKYVLLLESFCAGAPPIKSA